MAGIRATVIVTVLLLVSLPEEKRRSGGAQPLPGGGPTTVVVLSFGARFVFGDRLLELQVHRVQAWFCVEASFCVPFRLLQNLVRKEAIKKRNG